MVQFDRGRVKRRGKNATDRATENFRDFSTSDRPQTSKTDQDHRPIPTLQDGPYERAGSARERTLAEDVGCARGLAVRLRIIRLQFAYLLGLRCAPAQVRRELHGLADRFAGYLRDV